MSLTLRGTEISNVVRACLLSHLLSSLVRIKRRSSPRCGHMRDNTAAQTLAVERVRRRGRPVRAGAAAGRSYVHEWAHQPGGRPAAGRVRRRLRARGLRARLPL